MIKTHIGHLCPCARERHRRFGRLFSQTSLACGGPRCQTRRSCCPPNEKHHEVQLARWSRRRASTISALRLRTNGIWRPSGNRLTTAGAQILTETLPPEPGIDQALRARRAARPRARVLHRAWSVSRSVFEHYMPAAGPAVRPRVLCRSGLQRAASLPHRRLGLSASPTRWAKRVAWLRCDHEHHGVALVNAGTSATLHHYAFQLENWGAIPALTATALAFLGQAAWRGGPGRHGPGRNLYTYLPDPDNNHRRGLRPICSKCGTKAVTSRSTGADRGRVRH